MRNLIIKLLRNIFILSIPFLLVLILYIWLDPFKVIHHYSSYYVSGELMGVNTNRDYISTEVFIHQYPEYKYDSFIFGNSRSLSYEVKDWQPHIPTGKYFHFDAWDESIFGIYKKIDYLDKNNISIKNAIVLLDHGILAITNNQKGHIFMKHPLFSGVSWLSFQLEFFKTFLNRDFIGIYLDYIVSKEVKQYMITSFVMDPHVWIYHQEYNELTFGYTDSIISRNPDDYYNKKKNIFYPRDTIQRTYPFIIGRKQLEMLKAIADIFKKQHTDYKIIINPLYNQAKLNPTDIVVLDSIFGQTHVFDYSGINAITSDMHNYYETSHYRAHVAKMIMDEIYKNDKN